MATLPKELRRQLENGVKKARRVAEKGARKALEALGVGHHEPWPSMTPDERKLRNRLRAHGRQLGDKLDTNRGTQSIDRLTSEVAYEHWHRMLFARFLAQNELLIEPESGVAISIDEVKELARDRRGDWIDLASGWAQEMLPQIFRNGDPVLEVSLPPETRQELESILESLPSDVFLADDSLGWVYQFWQAERKDEINKSEVKIGADELPVVTQLFTEDYMVLFLLHNTLGAWWAGKVLEKNPDLAKSASSEEELRKACAVRGVEWTYLRFVRGERREASDERADGKWPNFVADEPEEADADREIDPAHPRQVRLSDPEGHSVRSERGETTREGKTEEHESAGPSRPSPLVSRTSPWRPAAGSFDGWPKNANEITMLDPCMGSGHFLVFALPILAAVRMEEEGLSREEAILAVLRDNLFGLEIDPRCTQIAAFNLALAAWKEIGWRELPPLNLACSGLGINAREEEWVALAGRNEGARQAMSQLWRLFAQAPILGSFVDTSKVADDLFTAQLESVVPVLESLLACEDPDDNVSELAVAAQGIVGAARILSRDFTLVATNVPYRRGRDLDPRVRDWVARRFPGADDNLYSTFLLRLLELTVRGGTIAAVSLSTWMYLKSYEAVRRQLMSTTELEIIADLGPRAFETISGEVVDVALVTASRLVRSDYEMVGVSARDSRSPSAKADHIRYGKLSRSSRSQHMRNPEARILLDGPAARRSLAEIVTPYVGLQNGDTLRYVMCFWEIDRETPIWEPFQLTPDGSEPWSGLSSWLRWEEGKGSLATDEGARIQGESAWGSRGVAVRQNYPYPASLYGGWKFDQSCTVLIPRRREDLALIWMYVTSDDYPSQIRRLDKKRNTTTSTFAKVPLPIDFGVSDATIPGLDSRNATNWSFSGLVSDAAHPLVCAVARLLGYCWPRQTGSSFPDCPALGPDGLERHADADGIVSLSPVKGEPGAADRLRALLADAYGSEWSPAKLNELLAQVGYAGKSLEAWLRDGFFEQHCGLFHQRPFLWQIWDGVADGFSVLVNYHRLAAPNGEGRKTLETVIYSYLGDWIERQHHDQNSGVEGSDLRLAAAEHLKAELEKILAGEPPYDLFVRWKPLHEQPIGWEPDINDGVRINIRPFMTAKSYKPRGRNACILRFTPKSIKWTKDRGKEPLRPRADYPWFWSWDERTEDFAGGKDFDANRWNDLHYTRAFKEAARKRHKETKK